MRADARLLSSLTTAFIECLAPPPPLLLTQLLAAAAAQLSVVEKHPFTQLQFPPPVFFVSDCVVPPLGRSSVQFTGRYFKQILAVKNVKILPSNSL